MRKGCKRPLFRVLAIVGLWFSVAAPLKGLTRLPGAEDFAPVPISWVEKYGLTFDTHPTPLSNDPDRDGFSSYMEWCGMDGLPHLDEAGKPVLGPEGKALPDDSTSPIDPEAHPSYHTRLTLFTVIPVATKLRLASYKGSANQPEKIRFSVVDEHRKKTFQCQIGKMIPGTSFRLKSFTAERKEPSNPNTKSAPHLTIVNVLDRKEFALPLGKTELAVNEFACFRYYLAPKIPYPPEGPSSVNKMASQTFTLPPKVQEVYTVLEIRPNEVDVRLPTGEVHTFRKSALPAAETAAPEAWKAEWQRFPK